MDALTNSWVGELERLVALTEPQIPIWVDQSLYPAKPIYNVGQTLTFRAAIDVNRFVLALQTVVAEHDALRIRCVEAEDGCRQFAANDTPVDLEFRDFSEEPHPEVAATAWIEGLFWQPLGLSDFPLFRFALAKLAPDHFVWLQKYHHLIIDATGRQRVAARVAAIYDALSAGIAPPANEAGAYLSIADHHVRCGASPEVTKDEDYWRARLADFPEPLFQSDLHSSEKSRSGRPKQLTWSLSREDSKKLREFARLQQSSLTKIVLALVWTGLSRLYSKSDLMLGVAVANRRSAADRHIVGQFAEVLPLRPRLDATMSLGAALAVVDSDLSQDLAHQSVGFRSLKHLVQQHCASDGICDVIVNVQRNEYGFSFRGGPVTCKNLSVGFAAPLTVAAFEFGPEDALHFVIAYDEGRICSEEAERFDRCLQGLLRCAPQSAAIPLGQLPILSERERRFVLNLGRGKQVDNLDATLASLLAEQAVRSPHATAVICGTERLTYRQLHARANRLAGRLIALGVGPNMLVGICLPRTVAMLIAVLAVHKAGGAYLPLDPLYPLQRLAYMVADSKTAIIVTNRAHRALIGDADAQILCVDDPEPAKIAVLKPGNGVKPGDLAYVLYTSGSTGRPKGVAVTHGNVVNLVRWARAVTSDGEISGVLFATSLNFDISVYEIFLPLAYGGAIIMVDDLFGVITAQARNQVRLINTVPSLMSALLAESSLPLRVQVVNLAGEAMSRALASQIFTDRPNVRLFNLYGPTETTVYSSYSLVDPGEAGPPPIGRPLFNTQLYVLDDFLQPVPVGCTGHVWIGGEGVAHGYLNLPELTQQRFIANPFGEGRIYHSGDLAAWRPDGQLDFAGRIDQQVKIRGARVELGEIEAVLLQHSSVRECCVVVGQNEKLVAYLTTVKASAGLIQELHDFLQQRLPSYMIPSAFERMDAFPLSLSGKLDRKALPALADRKTAPTSVPPRTATEQALAHIWREVLNRADLAIHDNFFESGGHSLLAMRLVARIRKTFAVDLPLRAIFENPTIAGLAHRIESSVSTLGATDGEGASSQSLTSVMPAVVGRDLLELSLAQQGLWFLAQTEATSKIYDIPLDVLLRGTLDKVALRRALDRLVSRHAPLRTAFELVDGRPVQRIAAADSGFALVEYDICDHADIEAELQRLVEDEVSTRFDLVRGPLIRGRLVVLSAEDHALLITVHHMVCDGWSMGTLVAELNQLYASFRRGEADPLPPLPVQYADYAAWQRQWLQGGVATRQADYWKTALSGAPALLALPTDRPRPPQQDFAGARFDVALDQPLTRRLKALSQRHGVTLYMTLLAGWAALLARLSGQNDVVIGSPSANRARTEIEPLIGFFVNTLPIRIDLSAAPTTAELLARVKAQVLAAHENQDLPFEQVVEALQPPRYPAFAPVFQVMFAWQNTAPGHFDLPGLEASPMARPQLTARVDLTLSLAEAGDEITGALEYATGLFDRATIERHICYWRHLLEAMANDDHKAIDRLPLMDDRERHRLLVEWNATGSPYAQTTNVHQAFEAQVAKAPDAIALVFGDQRLTYAQLDADANRLAHHLKNSGVKPNSFVGCSHQRSADMIVTLLAILKAGGAYVALDLNLPSGRLQSMMADAKPVAIVVQSAAQKAAIDQLQISCELDRPAVVIALEQDAESIRQQSAKQPSLEPIDSQSPAYVCFTSGSTGRPKGVVVPHRAILRLVVDSNYISITARDVFLQLAPLSFDASTFEIWGAVLNGAELVVAAPELLSAAELGSVIRRHQVSVLWLTAGLFHLMVDDALDDLSGVRQLLAGGDVLSVEHVRKALERLGEGRLINGYGPTENTTFTCCHPITRASLKRHSIPIGRPIAHTQCYILDHNLAPVPVGVRGELFAGGEGLALGYLNDPTLTAEKFIPNPFQPGQSLYRTGDVARYLADGTIEFLGRVDDQVKIRGFRVEPGEVEAAIKLHPAVRETAVLAQKDAAGDTALVAYVSPAEVDGLQTFLKQQLPAFMLPAHIVFLDALPLNQNGKVDRKALAALTLTEAGRSQVLPRTQNEAVLADIWRELLGRQEIGIQDNFFDLGGHSLLVVRLIDRVNRALNVRLTIADLFQYPTVEQMARLLQASPASRSTYPAGLVQIRQGRLNERGRPIFYLPGLGGNAFEFREVAEKLDGERPVIGIDLYDFDVEVSQFKSLNHSAHLVVQRLLQVQPEGRYTLVGFSFGGNLAVEVARQLLAEGQALDPVVLLDAHGPNSLQHPSGLRKLATHLRILRDLNFSAICGYIWSRIQRRWIVADEAVQAPVLPEDALERRIVEVSDACFAAYKTHIPEVFPGRMVLLSATDLDTWLEFADPTGTSGWGAFCKDEVEVIPMHCRHLDIFKEPNVTILARHIDRVLAEIDGARRNEGSLEPKVIFTDLDRSFEAANP